MEELLHFVRGASGIILSCISGTDVSTLLQHASPNCRMSLMVEYQCCFGSFEEWSVVTVGDLPPCQHGWLHEITSEQDVQIILALPCLLVHHATSALPPAWFTDQTLYIFGNVGGSAIASFPAWIEEAAMRRLVYGKWCQADPSLVVATFQELFCGARALQRILDVRSDWKVIGASPTLPPRAIVEVTRACANLQVLFIGWAPIPLDSNEMRVAMGHTHPARAVYWSAGLGSMNQSLILGPHDCPLLRNRLLHVRDMAYEPASPHRVLVDGGSDNLPDKVYSAVSAVTLVNGSTLVAHHLERFPYITKLHLGPRVNVGRLWPIVCTLCTLRVLELDLYEQTWTGLPECIDQLDQLWAFSVRMTCMRVDANSTVPTSLYRLRRLVAVSFDVHQTTGDDSLLDALMERLHQITRRNRTRIAMAAQLAVLGAWARRRGLQLSIELMTLVIQSTMQ